MNDIALSNDCLKERMVEILTKINLQHEEYRPIIVSCCGNILREYNIVTYINDELYERRMIPLDVLYDITAMVIDYMDILEIIDVHKLEAPAGFIEVNDIKMLIESLTVKVGTFPYGDNIESDLTNILDGITNKVEQTILSTITSKLIESNNIKTITKDELFKLNLTSDDAVIVSKEFLDNEGLDGGIDGGIEESDTSPESTFKKLAPSDVSEASFYVDNNSEGCYCIIGKMKSGNVIFAPYQLIASNGYNQKDSNLCDIRSRFGLLINNINESFTMYKII